MALQVRHVLAIVHAADESERKAVHGMLARHGIRYEDATAQYLRQFPGVVAPVVWMASRCFEGLMEIRDGISRLEMGLL